MSIEVETSRGEIEWQLCARISTLSPVLICKSRTALSLPASRLAASWCVRFITSLIVESMALNSVDHCLDDVNLVAFWLTFRVFSIPSYTSFQRFLYLFGGQPTTEYCVTAVTLEPFGWRVVLRRGKTHRDPAGNGSTLHRTLFKKWFSQPTKDRPAQILRAPATISRPARSWPSLISPTPSKSADGPYLR